MIFLMLYSVFRWREGKDPDPDGFMLPVAVFELVMELGLVALILSKVLP